ncbi:MAG: acyltransferase [Geitlerinemataceae cyanobacterium]
MQSSNLPARKRLDWIDRTKGLAILGIVLFHFFQNYPDRLFIVSFLDKFGAKFGLVAVDLFFVIAGFNISYSIKDKLLYNLAFWKSWLIKRLDRLYPTYIFAVCCSLLLYAVSGRSVRYFSLEFVMSFLGLGGYLLQAINPGFWFFTVILQAYLLTPVLYILLKANRRDFLIFGIVAGVLTKTICLQLEPGSSAYRYFLNNNFLGSYIFQFGLGLYWGCIYVSHGALRKSDYMTSLVLFCSGAIAYIGFAVQNIDIVYMQGFDIVFTPFLFILCILGFQFFENLKPIFPFLNVLSILGIYSYPIYLIHQPMLFVTLPEIVNSLTLDPTIKVMVCLSFTALLLLFYIIVFVKLENWLTKKLS